MQNEKILRKISALMNVTVQNGATVDEALTAVKKAQELIAKYHVAILENPTEKENVGEKNILALESGFNFLQTSSARTCPAE